MRLRRRRPPEVATLVTRSGCSLCAAAEPVVARAAAEAGVRFELLDVDDPAACDGADRARWTDKVPVVLLDGREHTWWTVDEPALRAALRGRGRRARPAGGL